MRVLCHGGAFAFWFALYLHLHLQPVVIGFGEWAFRGASWLAALLWDWLVVGGVIYLLTYVLGMPTFSAVSGAGRSADCCAGIAVRRSRR